MLPAGRPAGLLLADNELRSLAEVAGAAAAAAIAAGASASATTFAIRSLTGSSSQVTNRESINGF